MATDQAIAPNETSESAKQDFRTRLTNKLIERLEAGTAPWQKPWDARVDLMPQNPVTGKPYRGINNLALSLEGRSDPRWMTLKQAAAAGYRVNKGEKGSQIEYWKRTEQQPKLDAAGAPVLGTDGKPEKINVSLTRPRVFTAVVFNAEQMTGVPELIKSDRTYEWSPEERAEQILNASGAKITHEQADRAFYRSSTDSIHMPGKDQFASSQAYYGTALHELGHWTGHSSRLDRDLSGAYGSVSYAKEELRAELASYFLADRLGIPHDPGHHASYVASWVEVLRQDKNEIFKAAAAAEKITEYVIGLELDRSISQAQGLSNETSVIANELPVSSNAVANNASKPSRIMREEFVQFLEVDPNREYDPANADPNPTYNIRIQAIGDRFSYVTPVYDDGSISRFGDYGDGSGIQAGDYLKISFEAPMGVEAPSGRVVSFRGVSAAEKVLIDQAVKELSVLPRVAPDLSLHSEEHDEPRDNRRYEVLENLSSRLAGLPPYSYVPLSERDQPRSLSQELAIEDTILAVPFSQKELAKAAGAKWNPEAQFWYAPKNAPLEPLKNWLPNHKEVEQAMSAAARDANRDPHEEFGAAVRAAGLVLEGQPIMDGKFHRVPIEGKGAGNRDGAYVGHLDGKPAGFIQNHATGLKENWTIGGEELSADQKEQLRAQMQAAKQQREVGLAEQHEAVATKCHEKYYAAKPIFEDREHPYLEKKGTVFAYGVHVDAGGNLLIPMRDIDGKLWSIQSISPEGEKRFEAGGQKKGTMYFFNSDSDKSIPSKPIIVAEGFATAATIALHTNQNVVATFDAGNMEPVVAALKERFPTTPIFIAADNDRDKSVNVGVETATRVSEKYGVGLIVPQFPDGVKGSDFNDLASGTDFIKATTEISLVRDQIEKGIVSGEEQSRKAAISLGKSLLGEKATALNADAQLQLGTNEFCGKVLALTSLHVAQAAPGNEVVVHAIKSLDRLPIVGRDLSIKYQHDVGGRVIGLVKPTCKSLSKDLQR